ncbi:MAG: dihydroorotate dehydrogenase [candidate division FCPU426 bacterium]
MSPRAAAPSLSCTVGRVRLAAPVLLASGTCGYGLELAGHVDFPALGGVVLKSLTQEPRAGNPMPRVAECSQGMLNAIGLANVGVEAFCREKWPKVKALPCAVLANVAGASQAEYVAVARRLDRLDGLAGLELNVSCPNVSHGGMEFGREPRVLERLVAAVRKATKRPLWVKLTPNVADIAPLARAAEAAGADAITVINTLRGLRMDLKQQRPVLGNVTGGLSGPAIMPVALFHVYRAAGAVKIPVVGCGGIETAEDALEFILAGASAVQVGTATFRRPRAAELIAAGLRRQLQARGLRSLKPLIGAGRI